jgi:GT2 family glycosyltransferase
VFNLHWNDPDYLQHWRIEVQELTKNGVRGLIPGWVRWGYRSLRSRLLTIGLHPIGPFFLSDDEKQESGKISIIVAVHDSPDVTRRCLNSLEIFGGNSEIIIVDDESRLEPTRRLLDTTCSRNRWKLIRHEKALGHSRASEAGVLVSSRPYVCLLNSDTIVTPHSWLGVVRAFESDVRIAVSGPSTSHTVGPQSVRRALHCRHYWSDEQIWCFAEKYVASHWQKPVVDLPMVGGFAFFVRRTVWDELHGFDKNLPDYGNETEFCRRVTKSGLRIVWSKAGYIHHLGGESYGRTLGCLEITKRCIDSQDYITETV